MKERPILFSAPMVQAILGGRKTQTRRVVKVQPPGEGYELATCISTTGNKRDEGRHHWLLRDGLNVLDGAGQHFTCPYGYPGDRLWVRENGWERPERTPRMMREGADTWAPYYYDADPWSEQDFADFKAWGFKRRPSIHMPRWASRITLEITGVRVERLQDISDADAIAEGIERDTGMWRHYGCLTQAWIHPRDSYRSLWESLNGPGSWDANPWVWVVEFKRVES